MRLDCPQIAPRLPPDCLELTLRAPAVLDTARGVAWEDIAGLEHAKAVVQEVAVWPLLAPALFRGARAVPRGLLLFGPPGTGKARHVSMPHATSHMFDCSPMLTWRISSPDAHAI